jgi:hypothetical protein
VFSSYATHVASLHKALRAVQVASGTGAGKTQNMDKAKSAMKYAWHLRERLFSAAHQKELENWISSSKYFRFILAEEGAERAARSNGTAQGREDRETGEIGRASADREVWCTACPCFLSLVAVSVMICSQFDLCSVL